MNSASIVILNFIGRYSQINWALVDQAMVSGVNFCTGIILVRYLGLEEFGRFTLAWLIILFFNSIQFAAVISPMMSIGPKKAEKEFPKYYGAVFLQQLFWSTACFVSIFFCVWGSQFFFDWQIHKVSGPLATALLAVQSQDFLRRYFFVRERAALAFVNDCICYLGRLLLLVVYFQFRAFDIKEVLWLISCTSGLATVAGFYKTGQLIFIRIYVYRVIKEHWHFSKWLIVSALMQWASGNFFLIAAASVLGAFAVGVIKAAQNIIGITHILFQAMENFVPSKASFYYRQGGAICLINYLKKVTLIGGVVTLFIVLIISLFPKVWLSFFYGEKYSEVSYVVLWFSPIYLCIFLNFSLRSGLRSLNYTKAIFNGYLAMTTFSLISAYPIINWLKIHGAMVGILVTQIIFLFISSILFLFKVKKELNPNIET
jgi:O-antigen/teichoic acid export membrane protein